MTREEAKHKLDFMKKAYQKLIDEKVDSGKLVGDGVSGEWKAETPLDEAYKSMIDALEMAFEELEQETCDDCISREDALRALCKAVHKNDDTIPCPNQRVSCLWSKTKVQDYAEEILKLPPVTPQPKMGRWIIKYGKEQGYDIAGTKTWYIQIMCDKCGFIKTAIEGHTGQYKFCPNCGQPKMQEVEEN